MDKTTSKISICIPTYNREKYLRRCIESIIGYQGDDIEIIIQDNCSLDNTFSTVHSFKDKRIKYFRNDSNLGARVNIRTVIDRANGDYCFFLTDDDFLLPGGIDEIKEFISIHNPSVFKCDTIVFLEKSKRSYIYSAIKETKSAEELTLAEKAEIIVISHVLTGLCFRKCELDLKFYDNNIDLWYPSTLIIGLLSNKLGYLAKPVAVHIWENEIFWGIDPKSEELAKSEAKGIMILKERLDFEFYKVLLEKYLISSGIYGKNLLSEFSLSKRLKIRQIIFLRKAKDFIIRTLISIKNKL